jgi:hypothetical protein
MTSLIKTINSYSNLKKLKYQLNKNEFFKEELYFTKSWKITIELYFF